MAVLGAPYTNEIVDVERSPITEKYTLRKKIPGKHLREAVVRITKSNFPYPAWRGRELTLNGRTFRFIDVGGVIEKEDQGFIDVALQSAEPWSSARVEFAGAKAREINDVLTAQRLINEKVLKTYRERKNYIAETDFRDLRSSLFYNLSTSNMFVIIDATGLARGAVLSPEVIADRALLSVGLARYSSKDFLYPSGIDPHLFQALPHLVRQYRATHDQLPVEGTDVMDPRLRDYLRGRTAGEVTRLDAFQAHIPDELISFAFLQVMEAAKVPSTGVDVLVASVDHATNVLFRRKKLNLQYVPDVSRLDGFDDESRLFLETNSPEFDQTHATLKEKAKAVSITY